MANYVFNEDELDWLDQAHGFCSDSDDLWGDDTADSIILKLRDTWNNKLYKDNNQYEIELIDEEIEFIFEIMSDFSFDEYYNEIHNNREIIGRENNEDWISYKERLDLTNSIFEKIGKKILTIEGFEKDNKADIEELNQQKEEKLIALYKKFEIPIKKIELPYLDLCRGLLNRDMSIFEFFKLPLEKINQEFNLELEDQEFKKIKTHFTEIRNKKSLKLRYISEFFRDLFNQGYTGEKFFKRLIADSEKIFL